MWATLAILSYGAIFYGLRAEISPHIHDYGQAVYFAGTSFLTIGYGDYVPRSGLTRFCALAAGASGLGVVSVTTAFLFAIFGAFQTREAFVVTIGARSGAPPSGVGLLSIAALADIRDDLGTVMREAQSWTAHIMESHLAYPILAFFRSSHDYQSWIGTLGALLDASVLMMTTVEESSGQARILYNIGRHATHDLANYFSISSDGDSPGIERSEFEHACDRLHDAGYTIKDREVAWERFATLRSTYAKHLNGLAAFFQIPPVQWIGDRSIITSPHAGMPATDPLAP